jgi:hypothetical protein
MVNESIAEAMASASKYMILFFASLKTTRVRSFLLNFLSSSLRRTALVDKTPGPHSNAAFFWNFVKVQQMYIKK